MRKKETYAKKLMPFVEVEKWYNNYARRTRGKVTGKVYLRRLGNFCEVMKTDPKALVTQPAEKTYEDIDAYVNLLLNAGNRSSSILSCLKAIRSFLKYNKSKDNECNEAVEMSHKITLDNASLATSLENEIPPDQDELRRILMAAPDAKTRVIIALMAFSGLRPEAIGKGNDGLRIKDLPEMKITGSGIEFSHIPTVIRIRSDISKTGRPYLVFLCQEGCDYLVAYLRNRKKLTEESALVNPKTANKEFCSVQKISRAVRLSIRKAGYTWRPYVLRRYFATGMDLAKVEPGYGAFMMGHNGTMMATYVHNKGHIPESLEAMRNSYEKACSKLETQRDADVDIIAYRRLFLEDIMGITDYTREDLELPSPEFNKKFSYLEITSRVEAKAAGIALPPRGHKAQPVEPSEKIVHNEEELEVALREGWHHKTTLSAGKFIVSRA